MRTNNNNKLITAIVTNETRNLHKKKSIHKCTCVVGVFYVKLRRQTRSPRKIKMTNLFPPKNISAEQTVARGRCV